MVRYKTVTLRKSYPAYLDTDDENVFIYSVTATVAQWKFAKRHRRGPGSRTIAKMVNIANALGFSDHVQLVPLLYGPHLIHFSSGPPLGTA